MNRFQFVADHRDAFEVKRLCEIVEVARSSFYAWLAAAPGAGRAGRRGRGAGRADPGGPRRRQAPTARRGSPPSSTTAHRPAARVNHKRVARVMREHGIAGLRLRRRVRTTSPSRPTRRCPTCWAGTSPPPAPNQRYVGDITYLPIADGTNLYLATVIDCYSRRLAGWAVADHMRTDLVVDALSAARDTRGSLAGAIFHTDHGAQYTLEGLRPALRRARGHPVDGRGRHQRRQRAGRVVQRHPQTRDPARRARCWPDEATCRREVFRWVTRYNTRRRHSWCGQQSPITYEQQHAATLRLAA